MERPRVVNMIYSAGRDLFVNISSSRMTVRLGSLLGAILYESFPIKK